MFRASSLPIIRSFLLHIRHSWVLCGFWWLLPSRVRMELLSSSILNPDDGQRRCPKHVDFYTYLLTPWSRVLLENLTGSAASQEIPRIFGTRRFITVLTGTRHLSLSWANSIQSSQPPPTSWRSNLILSSHVRLGLPIGLFPSGFPTRTLCTPLLNNQLDQRFSNFFQVGTTFISQNVLRTTLLLGLSNSLGLP